MKKQNNTKGINVMYNSSVTTKGLTAGITLIALVVTIIILLILAGVAISSLAGENGLISKVQQTKKAQIKAELKEQLILALSELQLDKKGDATLDDVTQEWADGILEDYEPIVSSDASISGKKVTMSKAGVTGRYIIDEKLNIVETEETIGAQLTYEVKSREGENLQVIVTVTDNENGLQTIEYNDGHIQNANGLKIVSRDCTIQLGVEYRVKIISKSGEEKTEIILINEYYHTVTKKLGEGINIDNTAIKAEYNNSYTATLTAKDEYILDTISVTMGGEEVTVDKTTGTINIEKVTGDIVITATSKKVEIEISEVYVNTSQNATTSAKANSIDKLTTPNLYVTFTATLLGKSCTIEPPLTQAVTKNKTYTYTITGIYNGKSISITKNVVVNQFKSALNLVKYDAGDWTKEEIQTLQTLSLYDINVNKSKSDVFKLNNESGINFTFGGYTYKENEKYNDEINSGTIITSRNQSVAPESRSWNTKL